jgi:aspartate/methionine/tyrosine aminotransferase
LITVGSQEALALAVIGLVDPGEEVLIPDIGYPAYETLPRLAGAVPVRAPLDSFEAAVTSRTRMMIVGSPANPTGGVASAERVQRLADFAAERDLWLVSDEVYEELWLERAPRYAQGPRVLHVGGISKTLALTGLRLGWLVAPPTVCGELLGLHQNLVTCAPSLAQTAAQAGLALPVRDLESIRDEYRRRWAVMRELLTALPGARWLEPDGAFYVFVDLRERLESTTELAFRLARAGEVLVVPGEGFGPTGQGWLRLSFCATEEQIREGMRRLAAALVTAPVQA